MKRVEHSILSLSAPCLILLAILGVFQRQGSDRLQSLPAFLVGSGLIVSSSIGRRVRRKRLLIAIRQLEQMD